MSNPFDEFSEAIANELANRDIRRSVESLRNAPIYELQQQCDCLYSEPDGDGCCDMCGVRYREIRRG